ncbi:MAG: N-acetylmuramidase family protein [Leptospiraceae bacterium]|nr:N-acetylmuramidase family protein [Leptospiraceae bacterium]
MAVPVVNLANTSPESKKLTDYDYDVAAKKLGCDSAAIKAIVSVESSGNGFLKDGRPIVRFESHKFSKYTKGKFDASNPTISTPTMIVRKSKGPEDEYSLYEQAKALDEAAAMNSCSWGMFQIMGFNFAMCSYSTVQAFVADMHISEGKQLLAFTGFVISRKLVDSLKTKNWAKFAEGYNGKEYKKYNYDTRIAQAYQNFNIG